MEEEGELGKQAKEGSRQDQATPNPAAETAVISMLMLALLDTGNMQKAHPGKVTP